MTKTTKGRYCLCGCGELTKSVWSPGHDSIARDRAIHYLGFGNVAEFYIAVVKEGGRLRYPPGGQQ